MRNAPQPSGEDKRLSETPTIRNLSTQIHLLTRLVTRIDERQQTLEEQVKHVLDNTNRIIALLMPSQEP